MSNFDLVVIGGGPGGYAAAIGASQRGLSVALVEKRAPSQLGGTCLNVGCIPTKYLLECAKTWHKLQSLSKLGIKATGLSFDWQKILAGKDKLVARQRRGLLYLMKKNRIQVFEGHGSFGTSSSKPPYGIQIRSGAGTQSIMAKYVVLATGSKVRDLQILRDTELQSVYNSDEILSIPKVPDHLAIVGGGVIGMEFASLFAMMGSKITLIEAADQVLGEFDRDCVHELMSCWRQHNMTVHTSSLLETITSDSSTTTLTFKETKGKKAGSVKVSADAALIAIGREPVSEGLGLDQVGVTVDKKSSAIDVDEMCQTAAPGVYAIGDVIATSALAHTATAEAHLVVDHITGKQPQAMDYASNPLAVYSFPELASVGWHESQLQEQGVKYQTSRFPFSVMAKAVIEGYPEGFVKIHSDPDTTEILGVHIIGGRATEMISEFVLGKTLETTMEEFARVIRPHPTLSETLTEVALSALGEPLHAP